MTTENKQLQPVDMFRIDLQKMQPELKKLLPEHITVERFERVVLSAIQMNQDLLNLDKKSLFNSCLRAASDGLLPDGREAAIVPFGKDAQYMPMTFGIIKKMRNSGELQTIAANVVHQNDVFEYFVDQDGEHFSHKPEIFGDRGDPIGAYAMIKTKDGGLYFEVMQKKQIMAVKSASRASGSKASPWNGPFEMEMWRKSVIRRLSKRVPMSSEVERVIRANDNMIDLDAVVIESKADQIKKIIKNDIPEEKVVLQESPKDVVTAEATTEDKSAFGGFNPNVK